ncbi:MAG: threonine--tRNA ligase, partial [Patescibacteria group bacterium]
DTKLGIGPTIENGFYYDFLFKKPISPEVLPELEKLMREFISGKLEFKGKAVSPAEAKKVFSAGGGSAFGGKNQPFKLDLIKEFVKGKKKLTIYETRTPKTYNLKPITYFVDLCRGGHVKNTKEIDPQAFKLTHLAGAYWRGDEKNPMLTRIYGAAFNTKKELEEHLHMQEEAKKRDHRKLGQDLDLFVFRDEVGPGLPLFTEKGATVIREMERFIIDEEIRRGYRHVRTPDLARVRLYEISGHYPYYKDTMYPVMQVDEDKLVLRPMTCPHHFMLYSAKPHSYKELPLRIAEVAKLYRYEKSGELTGLMRVRSFCLADSHIFCTKEQTAEEIKKVIELIDYAVGQFGLVKGRDYAYRLSLGDPKNKKKYYNDPKGWREGEETLRQVLKSMRAPFDETKDEAAFYGPKIDVQMKNIAGKEETAFTVQYDFCLPARFKLKYINSKGKEEQPIVVHRASIGALERTMALLIEKYAGAFPLWLSPVQAQVLPVSEKFEKYARDIFEMIRGQGIRVEISDSNETLGKRIRQAEMQKIPYILVVGEKEEKNGTVNVRQRGPADTKAMAGKQEGET